jgi:hypothetical protein
MANPCCPKCAHTTFLRRPYVALNAYLIYCTNCGAVLGTLPITLTSQGTSTGSTGGKTAANTWTVS